ncbi:RecBCD enzyme subunit RecB [bioreactor metagenome]|uniref:RecBCD enzyme subunit RecB n=1 Tax=bioreactor metagenome TaxID=1076179 RepID=A0A644TTE7_9ZZZZ|nr:UvrD-helicase domain-containing protein [Desulfovibrio desulfuricans]MEA4990857.1 UvrD-helicase domain-containing protein [Desulfovibrio desulfuricans]
MINISDSDIAYAEGMLLPPGCIFDDERRTFIRELSSCDVLACPGSGKTTALLAKLLILSKKMPFSGGGGICVLTHTNVAIDEIKKRLGIDARTLINYPNFFGTIQSFVDRFLTIPKFIEEYGGRPCVIDTDRWVNSLSRECGKSSASPWISIQVKNNPTCNSSNDLLRKIILDPNTLDFDLSNIRLKDPNTQTHKAITACCKKVLSKGIISFEQAFALAEKYLNDHPTLSRLIASRYRFVLIDEMQDTDSRQIEVLDALFSEPSLVIQRVGDPNQAIFSVSKDGDMEWVPREPRLNFSTSMRFGEALAAAIDPIRIDTKITLAGNSKIKSHPPYMLTYDDSCMGGAIEAFGVLIQRLGLDSDPTTPRIFKAVGWIGQEKDTPCIPKYWPLYRSKLKLTPRFPNFISYVAAYNALASCAHSPSTFKSYMMEGLVGFAKWLPDEVVGRLPLTARRLERLLEKDYPEDLCLIRKKITAWLNQLVAGDEVAAVHADIVDFFSTSTVFATYAVAASKFLVDENIDSTCVQDEACNRMCCSEQLNVEIGTVHSVKGETHTGTLFLESKYQKKHDSEYLMPLLKGEGLKKPIGVHLKSCIKIAHVAMSRPTHLFAMACHINRIAEHANDLKQRGWELVSVKSLLEGDA